MYLPCSPESDCDGLSGLPRSPASDCDGLAGMMRLLELLSYLQPLGSPNIITCVCLCLKSVPESCPSQLVNFLTRTEDCEPVANK